MVIRMTKIDLYKLDLEQEKAIATANFLSNIRGPKLDLTGDDLGRNIRI